MSKIYNQISYIIIIIIIIIIIGIQPLGRFGQRPELCQTAGMALVRCILGKLLGVVCHCFPPRLDVPILDAGTLTVYKMPCNSFGW